MERIFTTQSSDKVKCIHLSFFGRPRPPFYSGEPLTSCKRGNEQALTRPKAKGDQKVKEQKLKSTFTRCQQLFSSHLLFSFLPSLKHVILPPLNCTTSQFWNNHYELLLVTMFVTIKGLLYVGKPSCKLIVLAIKSWDYQANQINVYQAYLFLDVPQWRHDRWNARVFYGMI